MTVSLGRWSLLPRNRSGSMAAPGPLIRIFMQLSFSEAAAAGFHRIEPGLGSPLTGENCCPINRLLRAKALALPTIGRSTVSFSLGVGTTVPWLTILGNSSHDWRGLSLVLAKE